MPSQVALSRTIVDVSWENVSDMTSGATIINADQFAGWDGLPVARNKDDVFTVWGDGDLMRNAVGQNVIVHAATGSGTEWLSLNNGVNTGSSARYQSLGIDRDIPTLEGASYTFSLVYAGALGLAAVNTRIGVYVDGVQIGSYANTSSNSALNWEDLNFSLKGNGQPRSLRIQLEGGADTSTARGAMIDALKVVETLPTSAEIAYGLMNGTVSLPVISSKLASGDTDATLRTELTGFVSGTLLSDGVRQVTVASTTAVVDVSAWNLAALVVTPPRNFEGTMTLQVKAISKELSNASTASAVRSISVRVLRGTACVTPAHLNPFLHYLAVTAPDGEQAAGVVATPLAATDVNASIYVPGLVSQVQPSANTEESMEEWMRKMSLTLGSAFEHLIDGIADNDG